MTEVEFFKLKSSLLEIELRSQRVQGVIDNINKARAELFARFGLDPTVVYDLDEEKLEAVPVGTQG